MTTISGHKNITKILIVSTSWLGDAIISLPAIYGIRSLFPEAHLTILAKDTIADIFKTVDAVNEIIPFHKEKGYKKALTVFLTASRLRKKAFDRAFIFPRSLGSALTCFLAGIPERIGFASNGRQFFLTEAVGRDREILSKHQVHYYKKLLKRSGAAIFPELPEVKVPNAERNWARECVASRRDPLKPFLVGINPGSTYGEAKQWLPERFEELAKKLVRDSGCDIIIFGDSNSSGLAEKINSSLESKAIDVTGKTSILQLVGLLNECDLLVTNDTGPMHVACAIKTPVVAVYGSTNPVTTSPLGKDAVMIKEDMACSPCMKRVCPEGHHLCMKKVSVEAVEKAVLQKLSALKKTDY